MGILDALLAGGGGDTLASGFGASPGGAGPIGPAGTQAAIAALSGQAPGGGGMGDDARVLARLPSLGGQQQAPGAAAAPQAEPSLLDAMGAGKMPQQISSNPVAAVGQGIMSGIQGAAEARDKKAKEAAAADLQRFNMLAKLMEMDRQAKRDSQADKHTAFQEGLQERQFGATQKNADRTFEAGRDDRKSADQRSDRQIGIQEQQLEETRKGNQFNRDRSVRQDDRQAGRDQAADERADRQDTETARRNRADERIRTDAQTNGPADDEADINAALQKDPQVQGWIKEIAGLTKNGAPFAGSAEEKRLNDINVAMAAKRKALQDKVTAGNTDKAEATPTGKRGARVPSADPSVPTPTLGAMGAGQAPAAAPADGIPVGSPVKAGQPPQDAPGGAKDQSQVPQAPAAGGTPTLDAMQGQPAATPPAPAPAAPQDAAPAAPAIPKGMTPNMVQQKAIQAVQNGADPAEVSKRLQGMGIDPSFLKNAPQASQASAGDDSSNDE